MVELRFFVVRDYGGEMENRIFRDLQWSAPKDLASYDFLRRMRRLWCGIWWQEGCFEHSLCKSPEGAAPKWERARGQQEL